MRFPPPTLLVILSPTRERAEAALVTLTEILAGLGLSLAAAKTSLVDLRVPTAGFDFLGFHHRRVESFTRKGRYFLSRWPSQRSVRRFKDRLRADTARRLLMLPVEDVVRHLNRFLIGWRSYFRYGNSTTVFHARRVHDGTAGPVHLEQARPPRAALRAAGADRSRGTGACPPGGKRPARGCACPPVKGRS